MTKVRRLDTFCTACACRVCVCVCVWSVDRQLVHAVVGEKDCSCPEVIRPYNDLSQTRAGHTSKLPD